MILYTRLQKHKYLCPVKITYELSGIKEAAARFWKEIDDKKLLAFHGNMGAGKTTFIHALCEVLKVRDIISSPTFAIINEYESPVVGIIYHMDWYRLKNEEEAIQAGVEECVQSGNICMIEWPEKMEQLLPANTLHIFIETLEEGRRKISVYK